MLNSQNHLELKKYNSILVEIWDTDAEITTDIKFYLEFY